MPDKSYVTMEVCVICQNDTGAILMDRRLKDTFERKTSFPHSVCDDCKEKYLKDGVMLINPENGQLVVLKVEAFKKAFNTKVPKGHIAYCEQEVLDMINKEAQDE